MEISIALHGDFGVVLDDGVMTPNDVLERLNEEIKMGVCQIKVAHTQSGSDGHGLLSRCVILTAKKSYAVVVRGLLKQ